MKALKKTLIAVWLSVAVCAALAFGCAVKTGSATVSLLESSQTTVAISVSEVQGKYTLEDCLRSLAATKDVEYKIEGTMLTSLNGVDNSAATFSYWMIYTSDETSASTAWGTLEYGGETFGSALKGVCELQVKSGCVYVFRYATPSL